MREAILEDQAFVRLVFKGHIREDILLWRQVIVRPVLVKNERSLQFSYFTAKQDITKNYRGNEAVEKLEELFSLPFSNITAQLSGETIRVSFSSKGKPLVLRAPVTTSSQQPDLSHDRQKNCCCPPIALMPFSWPVAL